VSSYRLDDRAIEVRSPAEIKDFSSSFCVQTGCGAHPASCTMGPGGRGRPGRDADPSPPSSAEVENEYELSSSPPKRLHGVQWDSFLTLKLSVSMACNMLMAGFHGFLKLNPSLLTIFRCSCISICFADLASASVPLNLIRWPDSTHDSL
jgi:hypothetical protein